MVVVYQTDDISHTVQIMRALLTEPLDSAICHIVCRRHKWCDQFCGQLLRCMCAHDEELEVLVIGAFSCVSGANEANSSTLCRWSRSFVEVNLSTHTEYLPGGPHVRQLKMIGGLLSYSAMV